MDDMRCPTCQKAFDSKQSVAMPFCSLRCKMIDLGRWLKEEIGMPAEPEDRDGQPPMAAHEDEQHE